MLSTIDKLKSQLTCKFNWVEIKANEYASYGIANLPEAQVVFSYKVGAIYNTFNTLTLYDYGKDKKFIKELDRSYNELSENAEEQKELGIMPVYWNICRKNAMLSVVKVIINQMLNVVDLFFVYDGNVFCFHTYLPGEETDFNEANLIQRYEVMEHIFKEIDGIKK